MGSVGFAALRPVREPTTKRLQVQIQLGYDFAIAWSAFVNLANKGSNPTDGYLGTMDNPSTQLVDDVD